MKLNKDTSNSKYIIEKYENDGITISQKKYCSSLIISHDKLIGNWNIKDISEININHFNEIFAINPDVIIIGSGKNHKFLDNKILAEIMAKGIGIEVMNTQSACRTYTVLESEGRNVVAALII